MSLCMVCRFPDEHKCTYNYVESGRAEISKKNPVIVKEKITKI